MATVRPHRTALGLLALLVACQGTDAPPTGAGPAVEPAAGPGSGPAAAKPIDWAGAGDCLAQLRVLETAIERGTLAEGDRPPVVVRMPERGPIEQWLEPKAEAVVADLPLVTDAADAVSASCTLEILPARNVRAEVREVRHETVLSLLRTGMRTERNPEFDVAAARLREAERELKDGGPGLLQVGDPMLDLIGLVVGGVISGFGQIGDRQEVDAALAELAKTPRSTERPVHRPYEFERTVLRGWREASFPVELVDRRHGRSWRAELRQRELRELYLLDGLDPRDESYEQHRAASMTRNELERWRREPPPVRLSNAVAALLDARAGPSLAQSYVEPDPPPPAGPEEGAAEPVEPVDSSRFDELDPPPAAFEDESRILRRTTARGQRIAARERQIPPDHESAAAPSREGSAQSEPRAAGAAAGREAASVVRVDFGERVGSGFYVAPHTILTRARPLGRASVIDVTTPDGTTVPGLISHVDRSRDLALVQVPKPGVALDLRAGGLPGSGTAVAAIGPGRAGAARAIPAMIETGPAQKAGLEPAGMLFLESATPADPAIAGGPVLHQGEVIAVIGDPGPGRGFFASPVGEVLDLLKDAGPAALR